MTNTFCRSCDLVHSSTRALPPYKWACLAFPVSGDESAPYPDLDPSWRPDPPFARCIEVRRSIRLAQGLDDCPEYTPRREPQLDGINA